MRVIRLQIKGHSKGHHQCSPQRSISPTLQSTTTTLHYKYTHLSEKWSCSKYTRYNCVTWLPPHCQFVPWLDKFLTNWNCSSWSMYQNSLQTCQAEVCINASLGSDAAIIDNDGSSLRTDIDCGLHLWFVYSIIKTICIHPSWNWMVSYSLGRLIGGRIFIPWMIFSFPLID